MTPALPLRQVAGGRLALSELGFGAAAIGGLYRSVADAEAADALHAALKGGFAYVDTAPYYGFGLSERRVGDAVRGRPEVVVSTKVGRLLAPAADADVAAERSGFHSPLPFAPVFDYSYAGVVRSWRESLQRLGLARTDLLLVHDIGRRTHGEADAAHWDDLTRGGGLRALEELRACGEIAGFGLGVNEVEACLRLLDVAQPDVLLVAGRYTLLEQDAVTTLLPRCTRRSVAVVVGGPFNSGVLAGGEAGAGSGGRYDYAEPPPPVLERVRRLRAVCARHGVPLAAAALQFPLAHPAVASVIPGLADAEQVRRALTLHAFPLPADLWAELRQEGLIDPSAPTPGGAGPSVP